jgi:hypothetical protein
MAVYDGVVSICELFSTKNSLCLSVVINSPGTAGYRYFCGYGGDVKFFGKFIVGLFGFWCARDLPSSSCSSFVG